MRIVAETAAANKITNPELISTKYNWSTIAEGLTLELAIQKAHDEYLTHRVRMVTTIPGTFAADRSRTALEPVAFAVDCWHSGSVPGAFAVDRSRIASGLGALAADRSRTALEPVAFAADRRRTAFASGAFAAD